MATFAMDDDCRVFPQISQDVRFDFVFFVFGIVSRHFSAVVAPRFFDHAFFPKEVGAFERTFLIGGFEDQTIAEIQGKDPRFFAAERRRQRSPALRV
jgi:hypothetical protein